MTPTLKTRRTFLTDLASAVGLLCVGGSCRDGEKDEPVFPDDLDLTSNIGTIHSLEIPLELPSLSSQLFRDALREDDSFITRDVYFRNGKETKTKIRLSDYLALRSRNHRVASVLEYGPFLTTHPTITNLSLVLTDDCFSLEQAAQRILNYIHQGIVYDLSIEGEGQDYVRHPLETLVEGNGDCEDTTILGVALSRARNLDVVLIEFPPLPGSGLGHIGYGVVGDFHGAYFEVNEKKYFYAETTGTEWLANPSTGEIGGISSDSIHQMVHIYTLHDTSPLKSPQKPL